MGILMFTLRVHDLMKRKSDIEYRLLKLTKKIQRLNDYSAFVGDNKFSPSALLSVPGLMMGETLNYMNRAQQFATGYMQQNSQYQLMLMAQQNGGQITPEMQYAVMDQMYSAGREIAMEAETRRLKAENEKLQTEKEQEEILLKEIDAELQSAKQAREASLKDMAPKYTAGGQ